ncbi:glycosyltransferase family 4 protein [Phototrophicus methaneseepsis]|uniref:Glycosyltransferase family 4 protein n=1 Tax=Phototrophicus methaneseepsis TaxID=2710758 RepID=A0A7S8EBM2_9CHLR|nr:glycosyltransferase family 4 protein [Phototrophicus methaneseepsis]QPC83990.1 glycosyltransferase family 4 protein [Phototrophicus methaneseepsis]
MRIAIFDYQMPPNNAISQCIQRLILAQCEEHEFTVFAIAYDNPRPDRIQFVRVPAIQWPLFVLFLTYHIMACLVYGWYRLRTGHKFDVIQSVESNTLMGTLIYSQFCHRAYLDHHWAATRPTGLRRWARWLDHQLHALIEPFAYNKAKWIVVPSHGLAKELQETYPQTADKVRIITNPISMADMLSRDGYDQVAQRRKWGFEADDLVMVFAALGHFERKGLPLLLQAMQQVKQQAKQQQTIPSSALKLIVVGGSEKTLIAYQQMSETLGLMDDVVFVGMQPDIRPFLWMGDLFVFPSLYETFSMVCYEAAAAGLPLLVSSLYGVEDMLKNGYNGWNIARTVDAYAEKIAYSLTHRQELRQMGQRAIASAQSADVHHFIEGWRHQYQSIAQDLSRTH